MFNKVWVVIPAAGESKRFREAGYDIPKPNLKLKNPDEDLATMLHHVVRPLPVDDSQDIYIALPPGVASTLPNHQVNIVKTTGQADTIYQVLQLLPEYDGVLVVDCDMILSEKDYKKIVGLLSIYDCVVAVTETFDPNSSRVDSVPFPRMFVEKEPISQYGIVGARGFTSIYNLKNALKMTLRDCKELNIEPYLSMAINHYPGTKYAHLIDEYTDLGTPERIKEAGWEIVA